MQSEDAFELRRQLSGVFPLLPFQGFGHTLAHEVSRPQSSGGCGLADHFSRGTAELEVEKDLPVLVGVVSGQDVDGQKLVQLPA
ncbi:MULTISPECIES: hypothetical protein [Streptomyces]|uniref:hypothetical protein n=1 Tax=Streptomyces TaxID=1883 RepID=UPI0014891597|nr:MULTISPECIES: hypothetical protein [Streptomyces]